MAGAAACRIFAPTTAAAAAAAAVEPATPRAWGVDERSALACIFNELSNRPVFGCLKVRTYQFGPNMVSSGPLRGDSNIVV